jgi:hypothetical protein
LAGARGARPEQRVGQRGPALPPWAACRRS